MLKHGLKALGLLLATAYTSPAHAEWTAFSQLDKPIPYNNVSTACEYRLKVVHRSAFYGTIARYYSANIFHKHAISATNRSAYFEFSAGNVGFNFATPITPIGAISGLNVTAYSVVLPDNRAPVLAGSYNTASGPYSAPLRRTTASEVFSLERNCK